MLYISRFIGTHRYGVVDTEDGVETSVSQYELEEYVMGLGIKIAGVGLGERTRHGRRERYIERVRVYQNTDHITREQAKLGLLRGVELKLNDSQIVSLSWDAGKIECNQKLRLSDFGTSCSDSILRDAPLLSTSHQLILVLDDNIKLSKSTFAGAYTHAAAIDVREVTQFSAVSMVYECYLKKPNIIGSLESFILDNKPRQDYFRGVIVLNVGLGAAYKLASLVNDCREVTDKIARKYKRQFDAVSRAKYLAIQNDRWAASAKRYYSWVCAPQYRYFLDDAEMILENRLYFVKIFEAMSELSTVDKNVLVRFENFMLNFEPVPEINEMFARFVERASKFIIEYGDSHAWSRG